MAVNLFLVEYDCKRKQVLTTQTGDLDEFIVHALSQYDSKKPVRVLAIKASFDIMSLMIGKDPKAADTYVERGCISMLTPVLIEGGHSQSQRDIVRAACNFLHEITNL